MQDWVEKNYDFKVNTACNEEVNGNEGLPMYDAPNAVEVLKHPRSHPTAEMVQAIRQALKHFEFIQQRKELEISNSLILCKYLEKL